ncbi:hypothetical protein ACK3TF_003975 [Chlorella vulgaris]
MRATSPVLRSFAPPWPPTLTRSDASMTDDSVSCPLATSLPHSWAEHSGPGTQLPGIRAYKLGKKRWSYNQVELVLGEVDGGARTAAIRQDSAVGFHVELESGSKLQAHIFLCYDKHASRSGGSSGDGASTEAGSEHHAWHLVTRKDCCKGCEGRVLRSIQRFGRQGKGCRNGDTQPAPASAGDAAGSSAAAAPVSSKKDPRFMYLSLDEACTHVNASAFRLVAGIYNRQGTRLLATSVSPPIRVLANNDVPTGTARFKLEAHLPADWEGWAPQAPQLTPVELLATSRPHKQAVRPRPFTTAAGTRIRGTATFPNPALPAIRTIPPCINPCGKEVLLQPGTKRQAVQQQPQFSELSSFDVWQLLASSPASDFPQPARSREASGHLVCSGGRPHAAAAYASMADYRHADAGSKTATPPSVGSLMLGATCAAAPHGCPEPPVHWLSPAGLAELASNAGNSGPTGGDAAQVEAKRQLNLLSQLKAGLLAASNQEASTGNDAVPAASAAPVACTAVEPAAPHLAEPLSDGGSVLAACWEQEVSQLQASSSAQPSASFVMPQWQPTSHYAMPAAEAPLMDSFGLDLPGSSHCEFATDEELETELRMMLPSHHKSPEIDLMHLDMDIDMVPPFAGDVIASLSDAWHQSAEQGCNIAGLMVGAALTGLPPPQHDLHWNCFRGARCRGQPMPLSSWEPPVDPDEEELEVDVYEHDGMRKEINGYTWPGIEFGEPPACAYTYFEYVDALRLGDLSRWLEIEKETELWYFPTLDRGAGATLHFAADHGQLRVAKFLIEKRHVEVNQIDSGRGWTPLVRCARMAHYKNAPYLELFEYLLQQGADPSILSYPSPDPDLYTVHGRAALPLQPPSHGPLSYLDVAVEKGFLWEPGAVRAELARLVQKYETVPKKPKYLYEGPELAKPGRRLLRAWDSLPKLYPPENWRAPPPAGYVTAQGARLASKEPWRPAGDNDGSDFMRPMTDEELREQKLFDGSTEHLHAPPTDPRPVEKYIPWEPGAAQAHAEASSIRAGGQVSLRRQHDTAHAALLLCNLQVQARAEGLQLCACFVDFRKAYDSVPRERLWDKLAAIGTAGPETVLPSQCHTGWGIQRKSGGGNDVGSLWCWLQAAVAAALTALRAVKLRNFTAQHSIALARRHCPPWGSSWTAISLSHLKRSGAERLQTAALHTGRMRRHAGCCQPGYTLSLPDGCARVAAGRPVRRWDPIQHMNFDCPLYASLRQPQPSACLANFAATVKLRAYKLGKKRWSYNQVELVLGQVDGGARTAAIRQDSAVGFHVELESGDKLQAHIFLCYDKHASRSGGGGSNDNGAAAVAGSEHHAWHLVTRKDCCKGCEGRVLRSIQRFGRPGNAKRSRNGATKPAVAPAGNAASGSLAVAPAASKKDPKCMYLSLDEACSHVNASAFCLVAGIYNRHGSRLLATSVSPPIRVLANNDVPTGAARFKLEAHLPADWEGWAPRAPQLAPFSTLTICGPQKSRVRGRQPKLITAAANQFSSTAILPHPALPPIRTKPPYLNSSSNEALLQHGAKHQAVQQQPQFSELSGLDEWQLLASSPASKLPQPARSVHASRHLVCSGGIPHAVAAYASATDYSNADAAPTTHTSSSVSSLLDIPYAAAPCGFPEPPTNWLAPGGVAELASSASNRGPTGDAAAQVEAKRQLSLLGQLKAGLLTASNEAASASNNDVPAASAEPMTWTGVAPAAPHFAEPLSESGSALAACWEQEVLQLQAPSSSHASASAVMPQWQPILHSMMPGAEWLLKDGFCLGMPDSSGCEFPTDEELETELGMMLPSQHKLPLVDMLDLDMDIDMVPLFAENVIRTGGEGFPVVAGAVRAELAQTYKTKPGRRLLSAWESLPKLHPTRTGGRRRLQVKSQPRRAAVWYPYHTPTDTPNRYPPPPCHHSNPLQATRLAS